MYTKKMISLINSFYLIINLKLGFYNAQEHFISMNFILNILSLQFLGNNNLIFYFLFYVILI